MVLKVVAGDGECKIFLKYDPTFQSREFLVKFDQVRHAKDAFLPFFMDYGVLGRILTVKFQFFLLGKLLDSNLMIAVHLFFLFVNRKTFFFLN